MERIEYWVFDDEFEMRYADNVPVAHIAAAYEPDSRPRKFTDLAAAVAYYSRIPVETYKQQSTIGKLLVCRVASLEAVLAEYDEDSNTSDYIRDEPFAVDWNQIPGNGFRAEAWVEQ